MERGLKILRKDMIEMRIGKTCRHIIYKRGPIAKRYARRDCTIAISRNPHKRRFFTASINVDGITKYIGTFDSLTDCIQAHKAYIRTRTFDIFNDVQTT